MRLRRCESICAFRLRLWFSLCDWRTRILLSRFSRFATSFCWLISACFDGSAPSARWCAGLAVKRFRLSTSTAPDLFFSRNFLIWSSACRIASSRSSTRFFSITICRVKRSPFICSSESTLFIFAAAATFAILLAHAPRSSASTRPRRRSHSRTRGGASSSRSGAGHWAISLRYECAGIVHRPHRARPPTLAASLAHHALGRFQVHVTGGYGLVLCLPMLLNRLRAR